MIYIQQVMMGAVIISYMVLSLLPHKKLTDKNLFKFLTLCAITLTVLFRPQFIEKCLEFLNWLCQVASLFFVYI